MFKTIVYIAYKAASHTYNNPIVQKGILQGKMGTTAIFHHSWPGTVYKGAELPKWAVEKIIDIFDYLS